MASSEAKDGDSDEWVKVLRRGQKTAGEGKSVYISNLNSSVVGFNSSINSFSSSNSVKKSVGNVRGSGPVGVRKYVPKSRRDELSWDFLANEFTPNFIQRRKFYPRTEEEDRAHRNSLLAGDGILPPPRSSTEKERRERVRRGQGNEKDYNLIQSQIDQEKERIELGRMLGKISQALPLY
ncbi:hypothetical protein ZOSMA_83G00360 [Zostera marina]|uniref:Uncharacterized protein n=1 Tax=Zostera marina TaxID=29655 RepID=A0A0K9NNX1_ZOSMR|nr:hypothetical protein ZOSMA_83G00360 [Zostera marina]